MKTESFLGAVLFAVIGCFFLFACQESEQIDAVGNGQRSQISSESLRKSSLGGSELSELVEGEAGIIGDPDFIVSQPPQKWARAWEMTGVIKVQHKDTSGATFGNGVFVRSTENGRLYVLTAKHVIYDKNTLKIKNTKGRFGYDTVNGKPVALNLFELPPTLDKFEQEEDLLLVPIEQADIDGFDFQKESSGTSRTLNVEQFDPLKLLSVGLKGRGKKLYKFYQNDFSLIAEKSGVMDAPLFYTDMDVLPGLSGSPVFIETNNGEIKLIGIVVKGSKQISCKRHLRFVCSNVVLLFSSP